MSFDEISSYSTEVLEEKAPRFNYNNEFQRLIGCRYGGTFENLEIHANEKTNLISTYESQLSVFTRRITRKSKLIVGAFSDRGSIQSDLDISSLLQSLLRSRKQINRKIRIEIRGWSSLNCEHEEICKRVISRLDLSQYRNKQEYFDSLDKKRTQSAIRRGEKSNLRLCTGKEYLADYYKLYSKTCLNKGTPPHIYGYFDDMSMMFPNDFCLITCLDENSKVISGLTAFFNSHTAFYLTSAIDRDSKESSYAGVMVMWSLLNLCFERKISILDFGRSERNSGVDRYKQQWLPTNYCGLNWVFDVSDKYIRVQVSDYGRSMKLLSHLVSKVPAKVVMGITPNLRRFVP